MVVIRRHTSAEYHLKSACEWDFIQKYVIMCACLAFEYNLVCKWSIVAVLTFQCVLRIDVTFHVNKSECFLSQYF